MEKTSLKSSAGNSSDLTNGYDISVVIISHSRKEFILDAFRSVIEQTFPRDRFEVVVVKNYEDEEIDGELQANQAKLVLELKESFGAKIASGIENSTGRTICFLDDDDIWSKEKLETVYTLFQSPDVVYYHNSQLFVDSELKPLEKDLLPSELGKMNEIGRLEISKDSGKRKLGLIYSASSDFNLSSISVSREFIQKFNSVIGAFDSTLDSLIFYLAFGSGSKLILDSRQLTSYRKHQNNISKIALSGTDKGSDIRKNFILRQARGFAEICDYFKRNGDSKTYRTVCPVAIGLEMIANLQDGHLGRSRLLAKLLKFIATAGIDLMMARKDFAFYGLLQIISPRKAKSVYVERSGNL